MQLMKLNGDSSWSLGMVAMTLILDPWLTGPQTDLAPWFSRQWHMKAAMSVASLKQVDGIIISHPFTDHCHEETLLQFSANITIWATSAAAKKIQSWKHFKQVNIIRKEKPVQIGDLSITLLQSSSILDQVHNALIFKAGEESLCYAPHGLQMNTENKQQLADAGTIKVLISTFSTYHLPFYLGGTVNLGAENALALARATKAAYFFPTHDEQKKAMGLVSKLARTQYPQKADEYFAAHGLHLLANDLPVGVEIEI